MTDFTRLEDVETEAVRLIEKHFKLRVHGDQQAYSQWSVPYVTWANGYMMKEGEITPDTTKLPQELLSAFDVWLASNRHCFDVIVMRRAPLCERWTDNKVLDEDGTALKTRLSMRCHFMKKEDI